MASPSEMGISSAAIALHPRMDTSYPPTAPSPRRRRSVASSCCGRFSASTSISARSPTGMRGAATSPSRRRCSIMPAVAPRSATTRTPSPLAATCAAGSGGTALCAICKPASTPPAKPAQSRCAVGYYGGQTAPFAHEQVRVPVLLHFGELDLRLPLSDIDKIRRHNPSIEVHMFPADHGFNCDHRKEWHAESAARALDLTLVFMRRHQRRLIPPRKQAVK